MRDQQRVGLATEERRYGSNDRDHHNADMFSKGLFSKGFKEGEYTPKNNKLIASWLKEIVEMKQPDSTWMAQLGDEQGANTYSSGVLHFEGNAIPITTLRDALETMMSNKQTSDTFELDLTGVYGKVYTAELIDQTGYSAYYLIMRSFLRKVKLWHWQVDTFLGYHDLTALEYLEVSHPPGGRPHIDGFVVVTRDKNTYKLGQNEYKKTVYRTVDSKKAGKAIPLDKQLETLFVSAQRILKSIEQLQKDNFWNLPRPDQHHHAARLITSEKAVNALERAFEELNKIIEDKSYKSLDAPQMLPGQTPEMENRDAEEGGAEEGGAEEDDAEEDDAEEDDAEEDDAEEDDAEKGDASAAQANTAPQANYDGFVQV